MCVDVCREVSERMEGVEEGVATILPLLDKRHITIAVSEKLDHMDHHIDPTKAFIYGDGGAAARAACIIGKHLGLAAYIMEEVDVNAHVCHIGSGLLQEYMYSPVVKSTRVSRHVNSDSPVEVRKTIDLFKGFALGHQAADLFGSDEHLHSSPPSLGGDAIPDDTVRNDINQRITVILTQYRRNTTEAQIHAIFAQTIFNQVDSIIIYQNEEHLDLSFLKDVDFSGGLCKHGKANMNDLGRLEKRRLQKKCARAKNIIHFIRSTFNFKYHGRFTIPLLVDSTYVAVFDDDTIPQRTWLEYAMDHSMRYNAIVGSVGVVVGRDRQYYFRPPLDVTMEVRLLFFLWNNDVPRMYLSLCNVTSVTVSRLSCLY